MTNHKIERIRLTMDVFDHRKIKRSTSLIQTIPDGSRFNKKTVHPTKMSNDLSFLHHFSNLTIQTIFYCLFSLRIGIQDGFKTFYETKFGCTVLLNEQFCIHLVGMNAHGDHCLRNVEIILKSSQFILNLFICSIPYKDLFTRKIMRMGGVPYLIVLKTMSSSTVFRL